MRDAMSSEGLRRPAVSVVIPTYNRRSWLERTLASVRSQTFDDHEVVLVDDASTDDTAGWARRNFPEVRVVRLVRNQGPAAARKRGIAEARGPLIAFLDSDDLWRAGYLRTLMPEFRDPRVVMTYSNFDCIDSDGRVTQRRMLRRWPSGLRGLPLTSALIVRRTAVAAVGGVDPRFRRLFDDVDLLARLTARYRREAFRLVDRALVLYRHHDFQLTSTLRPGFSVRGRRRRALTEAERGVLLDLAHLRLKHRRGPAPMLGARCRNAPATLAESGRGLFEFGLLQSASAGR
jgi:glycosyltransferase involved in cell wall biosynthesis